MKTDFLNLIDQIEDIERRFQKSSLGSTYRVIYQVPEFQLWIQRVQMELQEIVDRTKDQFAMGTLNESKEEFDGWNDKKHFDTLKNKLLVMKDNIDRYYIFDEKAYFDGKKSPKIFISHSSLDKEYVTELVDLLDGMGLTEEQIFCSSLPSYDIPMGESIFDYLRNQFLSFDLHVFFIHSKNYYQSVISLNEMGAAWALKTECTSILLPGFGFEEMTGVVGNQNIAIKLDSNEAGVKDKLDQLYGKLIEEFGLTRKSNSIWERKRDRFIKKVNEIAIQADSSAEQHGV